MFEVRDTPPLVDDRSFLRRHALRFVNVAVLAILGTLLYRQVDVGELRTAIRSADLAFVLAAFSLNIPIAVLFVLRSHLVLLRLGHRVEPRVLISAVILGNVAGSLTPASTGELLRATALRGHAQIPTSDSIALVLFERALSVYLMALATGVAAAFAWLSPRQAFVVAAMSVPLWIAPALGPLFLNALPVAGEGERLSFVARALAHVRSALGRVSWILKDRRLLAVWSAMTVTILALSTAQVWLLARGISGAINAEEASASFGISQLAGIASLLPLGVGAVDGSLAAMLHKFGFTLEQGAATAVLLRLVVTIPYGITAIACYLYLQRLGSSRRRSADAAETRPSTTPDP